MTDANITWIEDMQFVAQGDSGHPIVMDASEEIGGHGAGARPMEVLLMGILGCTAMDVISVLKKKRQTVHGLKVFATGERAPEQPKYFTKIHLEYVAYGEVDPVALARSIQLSEEKYCSAIATVRGSAQFTSSYRVEKAG
jgi:putative redox protein